jgi:small subunit ribosomal protein S8e
MGISRDSRHKRRLTGGRMPIHKKKRLFESGRQPAMTKIGDKRIKRIRVRGGNFKFRAIRLEKGSFSWASQSVTRPTRVLDVVYNASNNELVRTKTLVKNSIILIDAAEFKKWYLRHFGTELGKKAVKKEGEKDVKQSKHVLRKLDSRRKDNFIDPKVEEQFASGRLLACITSRPGQSGRCDGYILEGKELEFYMKKMEKRTKG